MPSSDPLLNLPLYQGQMSATFRFTTVHAVTGLNKGPLTPLRDADPVLDHDTTSTISRRLSNLLLGVDDAARFNPLTDRVTVTMVLGDTARTQYPLGRYMAADATEAVRSQGSVLPLTLFDEMFILDQDMEAGFDAARQPVDVAMRRLLDGQPVGEALIDSTDQLSANAWAAGTSRASVLNELANVGGYFKPWFNHLNQLRLKRAFEPGDQVPDIDLDDPPRVYRDSIARSDNLLTAANRFVVISNDTGGTYGADGETRLTPRPVVGVYDVPSSAPYSRTQRGFVIPEHHEAQILTAVQAAVYARTLGLQRSLYERVELSTPPDPRHDGYDVVRWNGLLWLETGWSMPLVPGGAMRHQLRRAYPSTGEEGV